MIKILLADDQPLVRTGFRMILDTEPDISVAGEAGDGDSAVRECLRLRPDVTVMDIRMPVRDGISATAEIAGHTRVLVLTTFHLDEYVVNALRAGASGFLLKDLDPDDLRQAVRLVAAGEALLAPSITRRVIGEFARSKPRGPEYAARLALLTDREREIVVCVGEGLSNDEIADRLGISPTTAKTHVSRAMTKVDARDRAQLVVFAYECGLITPAGP